MQVEGYARRGYRLCNQLFSYTANLEILTWWRRSEILHRVTFAICILLWIVPKLWSWHVLDSLSAREEELHRLSSEIRL